MRFAKQNFGFGTLQSRTNIPDRVRYRRCNRKHVKLNRVPGPLSTLIAGRLKFLDSPAANRFTGEKITH